VTDIDTPEPLTDWLKGTLTLVFAHGATVTRHTPLSTAIEVRQIAAGTREADRLGWCETGWLQFEREQLVFTDFVLDEDGGWPLSADDRRTLDLTPYNRGVLVALRDYWQSQKSPEVAYSARAIVTLHRNTLRNPAPEAWARMARALEGEAGAERVLDIYDTVAREHADGEAEAEDPLDLEVDHDDLDDYPPTPTPGEGQTPDDAVPDDQSAAENAHSDDDEQGGGAESEEA